MSTKINIFFLLITTIQFSLILSGNEKCYSIYNCLRCDELDYCDECIQGFILNNERTKCLAVKGQKPKPSPKKDDLPPKPSPQPQPSPNNKQPQPSPNNAQPKPSPNNPQPQPSPNNPPPQPQININNNNPFKNLPISSFQRLKDRDMNNVIINRILIFILVVLILSIIASIIQSVIKKFCNKGYYEEEGRDETAKVVYIR